MDESEEVPPGHRFELHYQRERRERGKGSVGKRVIWVGAALVAIAVGIVLVFIPGPAILFFAIAGAILAAQSLAVARALDWCEVRARAVVRATRRRIGASKR